MHNRHIHDSEKKQEILKKIRNRYKFEHRHLSKLPLDDLLTFTEVSRIIYANAGAIIEKGTYNLYYSRECTGRFPEYYQHILSISISQKCPST